MPPEHLEALRKQIFWRSLLTNACAATIILAIWCVVLAMTPRPL